MSMHDKYYDQHRHDAMTSHGHWRYEASPLHFKLRERCDPCLCLLPYKKNYFCSIIFCIIPSGSRFLGHSAHFTMPLIAYRQLAHYPTCYWSFNRLWSGSLPPGYHYHHDPVSLRGGCQCSSNCRSNCFLYKILPQWLRSVMGLCRLMNTLPSLSFPLAMLSPRHGCQISPNCRDNCFMCYVSFTMTPPGYRAVWTYEHISHSFFPTCHAVPSPWEA